MENFQVVALVQSIGCHSSSSTLIGVVIPVAIATPFFFGSKMGGIYEVPPDHRDGFPQGTSERKRP